MPYNQLMLPMTYLRLANFGHKQVKDKSAVSAAFELCVSMDPKTRPKFEFRGGVKSKTAVSNPPNVPASSLYG